MKRGPLLAAIAVAAVAAGAAVAVFYSWSRNAAEEQRLSDLSREVAAEIAKRPVNAGACQALLGRLSRDARRDDDPRLVRGRAELMLLLGKPTQQAWAVIEVQATGVDPEPEDCLLGARILERRHAETGKADQAFHGAVLAEQHYQATGKPESLLMAWLMYFRAGDKSAARIEAMLASQFADSPPARLVAALAAFYRSYLGNPRSVDKEALQKLAALDREVESPPPELAIALAARDIDGSLEQVQSALDRLELVVKSYRSSVLARELLALGYVKLRTVQGCEQSLFHLDWLLKNHPDSPAAELWRNLRPAVQGELERLRKGQNPVK